MRMSDWSSDVCSSDLAVKRATDRSLSAVQLVFVVLAGDIECRTAAGINAKERAPQGMACGQLLNQQGFDRAAGAGETGRSEERRGGKECVRTWRSRWSAYHSKKIKNNKRTARQ